MDPVELRRLALLGARARLVEIDTERERLLEEFPELARKPRGPIAKASNEPRVLFDAGKSRAVPRNEIADRVAELVKRGLSMPEIVESLGCDKSTVYRIVKLRGLKLKRAPRGGAARKRKSKPEPEPEGKRTRRILSDELKDEVVDRIRRGEFLPDIVREYAIRDSVIRRWLQKARVKAPRMPPEERAKRSGGGGEKAAASGKRGPLARKWRPQQIDNAKREELLRRAAAGEKAYAVAKELGIGKSTAYGWLQGKGAAREAEQQTSEEG